MAVHPTRLLVLGLVRMLQPVHGYDVRRELMSWRADEWANIAPGSIYGALNTLVRDGWIEVVPADSGPGADDAAGGPSRGRPGRTTYRVTDMGEMEFHQMLRESWRTSALPRHPALPAVALLPFTDRDDVVAALRYRVSTLEAEADYTRREIQRVLAGSGNPEDSIPHHVAEMSRLSLLHVEADLAWARDLLARVEAGDVDVWTAAGLTGAGWPEHALQRVGRADMSN